MERESRESWASFLLPTALIIGLVALLNLDGNVESNVEGAWSHADNPLEPWLKLIVGYLAIGAEIAAALVIGLAVIRAIFTYLRHLLTHDSHSSSRCGCGWVAP